MFAVRYDALIGSFLGETNQRLRRLFDYIRTVPSVLLFDEFDALGKERGDVHETGEIKRVVSSLLLQIDSLPSYVVTIAATNHSELLDRAAWRRFEIRLELPQPSHGDLAIFFAKNLSTWKEPLGMTPGDIARKLGSVSYAEATDFCLDVRRQYVLALGEHRLSDLLRERVSLWSKRFRASGNAKRSHKASFKTR
jgi:AAA+ superfamily predicted ATPase